MTPGAPPNLSLEVSLVLRAKEAVSGAAIPVVVVLRNTAAAGAAIVHSRQADMSFIFKVKPEQGDEFDVSRDLYQQQTMPNPPPPREQEMAPLRAGSSLEYPVDLARWMKTPLKPGRYQISAVYPLRGAIYRSAPVALQVITPRAGLLQVAPSGNRLSLGAVLIHADQNGASVLYQRESESGRPDSGAFHARKALHHPTSVALSTDAEGATEPRWIGWTEEGKAAFLHVWAAAELYSSQAVSVGAEARLVSPGWTFDDESVVFLAATDSSLSVITIQNREEPRVKTFAIEGGISDPSAVRAGFFKTQQDPPARRLLAVWPAGSRLMCSIVNPDGDTASARELASREEPLIALAIEPVGREAAPIIHAVFSKPSGSSAHLVRIRAGEEIQTTPVPALPETVAGLALQWEVVAGVTPAVAVAAGNRILAWRPEGEWTSIYDSAQSAPSHLQLVQLEEAWAVWTGGAGGLQYRELSR